MRSARRTPTRRSGPNTVIVGAAVLLATIVAVVVAIQATTRLPFQSLYSLRLLAPNAAQVTKNAAVTIAGTRVGEVTSVSAVRGPGGPGRAGGAGGAGGTPFAELLLAIDRRYAPLPVDSTYAIQLTGTLGAKVVEITPGTSSRMLPDGAVVPAAQAVPRPVDVDQVLDAFSAGARAGARASLLGFGAGLAGRGADLNTAISQLLPLSGDLTPVMRALAAPSTGLGAFVSSADRLFSELDGVAERQAMLVRELDRTFGALAPTAPQLALAIERSPQTLADGTAAIQQTQPLLAATTRLLAELRPAAAALPATVPALAGALSYGARNLPRLPHASAEIGRGLEVLARFSQTAPALPGVQRLQLTFATAQPLLAFLTPAQTTCNYPALVIRNVASLFKDHVATGTMARAGGVVIGVATNSERGPSTTYFQGKPAHALGPLHWNPYPYTAAPGQPRSCEAGHEPYIQSRAVIGNVPVTTPGTTESAVSLP